MISIDCDAYHIDVSCGDITIQLIRVKNPRRSAAHLEILLRQILEETGTEPILSETQKLLGWR